MASIFRKMQSLSIQKIQKKCLDPYLSTPGKGLFLLSENLTPEHFFSQLPPPRLTGMTLSPYVIHKTSSIGQFSFAHIQSNYEKMPLRSHQFNLAIVPYLLEYCENPTALINETYRCLSGEGKLLLFGIQHYHPWALFNTCKPKIFLSLFMVKQLLMQANFSINGIKHFHYGSLYIIEAQKHIQTLIPTHAQWAQAPLDKIWVSLHEGKT